MKKILSLLFFVAIAAFAYAQDEQPVKLYGGIQQEDGTLAFKFKNTSGTTIANCNFQLQFPEGISIKKNSTGKKFLYNEGDATEGMTFSIAYNATSNKYTVTVYDGEFDQNAGHTIISLPLEGELTGTVAVSAIAFGDPDGKDFEAANIASFPDFTIDLATAINGISAEQTKSGAIYNLAGQRVSKANKGIYVVDGKKVAVK